MTKKAFAAGVALALACCCIGAARAQGTIGAAPAPLVGGYVNKFRNGTFDIWQRGTSGLTATTAGAYTADGWIVTPTGASVTAARAGGLNAATLYALQVTGAASVTALTITQRIESTIAAPLAGQRVTLQFAFQQTTSAAVTPTVSACYASAQDNFATCTGDLTATGLTACASGTVCLETINFLASSNAKNGYQISIGCGAVVAAQTCTIAAADIRAVPAGPPEMRIVSEEMVFCERYYAKTYQMTVVAGSVSFPGVIRGVTNGTGGRSSLYWPLPVRMRAAPTVQIYSSTTGAAGKVYDEDSAADIPAYVYGVGESGIGAVDVTGTASHSVLAHFTASAEL